MTRTRIIRKRVPSRTTRAAASKSRAKKVVSKKVVKAVAKPTKAIAKKDQSTEDMVRSYLQNNKILIQQAVAKSKQKTKEKKDKDKDGALTKKTTKRTKKILRTPAKKVVKKAKKITKSTSSSKPAKKSAKKVQNIPVDDHVSMSFAYSVYSNSSETFAKTLNLSNIGYNNNKFYIVQVLKKVSNYFLFTRWGRVGDVGQFSLKNCGSKVSTALSAYSAKLSNKVGKGYCPIDIDYSSEDDKKTKSNINPNKKMEEDSKTSKHGQSVSQLIRLMYDMEMVQNVMAENGYDAKKMPLGKLSIEAIRKAYSILGDLSKELSKKKKNSSKIQELNNQFFTQIPHNIGRQQMRNYMLRTEAQIKQKLKFLESLDHMKIVSNLSKNKDDSNFIDQNYDKLKCDIKQVPKTSKKFKLLQNYLISSNDSTHRCYNIDISDIYELDREGEKNRFDKHCKNIGNRRLLWHGSRVTNFVGIISEGLRIAPPSAPASGYNFGKGVYFADMIAKSACYCRAESTNMDALILLCEVACGNPNEKSYFDYNAAQLPPGTHSTYGMGSNYPDPSKEIVDDDGVVIPMGPRAKNGDGKQRGIGYDEWIVYNKSQIKMKYLLRCKFVR